MDTSKRGISELPGSGGTRSTRPRGAATVVGRPNPPRAGATLVGGTDEEMDKTNIFLGNWRIVETELWDLDDLDLVTPATLSLNPNHQGHIAFIAVEGQLDYRVVVRDGLPAIEFSFEGFDEGDEVMGRGWAVLDGEHLHGRLFFHQGDDSSFVDEREHKDNSRKAPANKRLQPTAPMKQKRRG